MALTAPKTGQHPLTCSRIVGVLDQLSQHTTELCAVARQHFVDEHSLIDRDVLRIAEIKLLGLIHEFIEAHALRFAPNLRSNIGSGHTEAGQEIKTWDGGPPHPLFKQRHGHGHGH